MNHDVFAYGLWMFVVLNSAVFRMFAFSVFKPQTARDWRTFGAFAAFIVAQFAETYERYALRTPRFIPALKQPSAAN